MAILIFLRGVCEYVWVNIHTLSPQRVEEKEEEEEEDAIA